MTGERRSVLGYPLDAVSIGEATEWVLKRAEKPAAAGGGSLLVTLNPEIVVQAEGDPALAAALRAADLAVADGVGVAWAARRAGVSLPERVPGVDLTLAVLKGGGGALRVYFLGGRPGVAERAAGAAAARFGTSVAGHHHGYFDRGDPEEVTRLLSAVRASRPALLLAGLGEGQELFLHQHRAALQAPVMMGVGGTLDVLAGEVRRMPSWTTRLGVEWLFRVALDRRRWGRVPRLVNFVRLVGRELPRRQQRC